jgi:hypothetical protein
MSCRWCGCKMVSGRKHDDTTAPPSTSDAAPELRPEVIEEQLYANAEILRQRALDNFAAVAKFAFYLGTKKALPLVLRTYLGWGMLPPKWAQEELVNAYSADVKSWDDVFGKRSKDKRSRTGEKAYREGEKLRKQHGYKRSDDSPLFPELGKILGVSGSRAKDYYYSKAKKEADDILAVAEELQLPEDKADRDPLVVIFHQTNMLIQKTNSALQKLENFRRVFEASVRNNTSEKSASKPRINKSAGGGRRK